MHVLIIGGTRFVGYQLAWRLVAGGHRITLLNRGTHPDPFGDRVERLKADRTTPEFARALAGRSFDGVVDFAAFSAQDTVGAMEALGERAGHYVFISTGQVYLVREGCPRPARESDYDGPLLPRPAGEYHLASWEYGVHKREAEDALVRAWAEAQFPSTRIRIPMVNGERDHFRRIESYLWRILDGGPVLLPDGGLHQTRHVYSGSVVDGLMRILGDAGTFGKAYNLAQDETPTLAELVRMLAGMLGAPDRAIAVPRERVVGAGLDPRDVSPFSGEWMSFLDPSKSKVELGFRHQPLERYLEKIVACHLNNPPEGPPPGYARRDEERRLA